MRNEKYKQCEIAVRARISPGACTNISVSISRTRVCVPCARTMSPRSARSVAGLMCADMYRVCACVRVSACLAERTRAPAITILPQYVWQTVPWRATSESGFPAARTLCFCVRRTLRSSRRRRSRLWSTAGTWLFISTREPHTRTQTGGLRLVVCVYV